MDFLLIHSPLVGPTTWRWVAAALSAAGHDAVLPDLRSSAVAGKPQSFVDEAVSSTPSDWSRPVVVGHSGAGFLLPSIVERLDAAHAVFVDAGLPPDRSPASAGADILDRLRALAVDGTLPKWSTWWGPDVMRALVPDDTRRATSRCRAARGPDRVLRGGHGAPDRLGPAVVLVPASERGLPCRRGQGEVARVVADRERGRALGHRERAWSRRFSHRRPGASGRCLTCSCLPSTLARRPVCSSSASAMSVSTGLRHPQPRLQ